MQRARAADPGALRAPRRRRPSATRSGRRSQAAVRGAARGGRRRRQRCRCPGWPQPLADGAGHAARPRAAGARRAPASARCQFALALAQAWLCEAPARRPRRAPCGRCGSCRLVQARVHPDLLVLLPESAAPRARLAAGRRQGRRRRRQAQAQPADPDRRGARGSSTGRTRTSARGRGKVAVLHPAEALNAAVGQRPAEDAGGAAGRHAAGADRGRPGAAAAHRAQPLPAPARCRRRRPTQAAAWLAAQGVAAARRCCWPPPAAGRWTRWRWPQAGVDAAAWAALPRRVARGQARRAGGLAGAAGRRCAAEAVPRRHGARRRRRAALTSRPRACRPARAWPALAAWSRELPRVARHDEHPWSEALMIEALVTQGRAALAVPRAAAPRAAGLRYTAAMSDAPVTRPGGSARRGGAGRGGAAERDPARVPREGRAVRRLHPAAHRRRAVRADHARIPARRGHLPAAVAARRPAALPGGRQGGLDHAGQRLRRPHPGRRRALPERREDAPAEAQDRGDAGHHASRRPSRRRRSERPAPAPRAGRPRRAACSSTPTAT